MSTLDQAVQTQLSNIEKSTGKSLEALYAVITGSGLAKHGEIVKMLKADLGLGHGNANLITTLYLRSRQADGGAPDDPLASIYSGAKAALRPLHDAVMAVVQQLGEFETAPKKTYLSLRRKKQFAMVGPGSKGRLEIGLNIKDTPITGGDGADGRLQALPAGKMCQYRVFLTDTAEVDVVLVGWLRQAYQAAG